MDWRHGEQGIPTAFGAPIGSLLSCQLVGVTGKRPPRYRVWTETRQKKHPLARLGRILSPTPDLDHEAVLKASLCNNRPSLAAPVHNKALDLIREILTPAQVNQAGPKATCLRSHATNKSYLIRLSCVLTR